MTERICFFYLYQPRRHATESNIDLAAAGALTRIPKRAKLDECASWGTTRYSGPHPVHIVWAGIRTGQLGSKLDPMEHGHIGWSRCICFGMISTIPGQRGTVKEQVEKKHKKYISQHGNLSHQYMSSQLSAAPAQSNCPLPPSLLFVRLVSSHQVCSHS